MTFAPDTEAALQAAAFLVNTGLRRDGVDALATVADLHFTQGPPMIRSEGGKLVGYVFVDTDRPIADYVHQAKQVVAAQVKLPAGIRLGWAGQFTYLERAKARLKVVGSR